jgi:hypothetical protein
MQNCQHDHDAYVDTTLCASAVRVRAIDSVLS